MDAFLNNGTLLWDVPLLKKNRQSIKKKNNGKSTHAVGVFSHHRDVKVALDDLRDAGFPKDLVTVIARNPKNYSWSSNSDSHNHLNKKNLSWNQIAQHFYQRLFQREQYLILVVGNEKDLNFASLIMGRRKRHARVFLMDAE